MWTNTLGEADPPSPSQRYTVSKRRARQNNPQSQSPQLIRRRRWRVWWNSAATATWAQQTAFLSPAAHPGEATLSSGDKTPPEPPERPGPAVNPGEVQPWKAPRCEPASWPNRTTCQCPGRCPHWPPGWAEYPWPSPYSRAWRWWWIRTSDPWGTLPPWSSGTLQEKKGGEGKIGEEGVGKKMILEDNILLANNIVIKYM